jgi:hypothetical protein
LIRIVEPFPALPTGCDSFPPASQGSISRAAVSMATDNSLAIGCFRYPAFAVLIWTFSCPGSWQAYRRVVIPRVEKMVYLTGFFAGL